MLRIFLITCLLFCSTIGFAQQYDSCNKQFLQLYKQGKYQEAKEWALKAKDAAKTEFGGQSKIYTTTLYNMALLCEDMNDIPGAAALYNESIEIIQRVYGKEDADYCSSLSNLALLFFRGGDYTTAESMNKEVLAIRERILGEKHPLYANSLNNLALLYVKTGHYLESEYLYKKALTIRKSLGELTLPYAQSLNNLGFLYYTMGNYGPVESLYLQALAIRKKISGEQHVDYGNTLNKLGLLYYATGNYSAAEKFCQQALDIYQLGYGENHPEYAGVVNNIAMIYYSRGNYTAAETLYKKVLEIYKKTIGSSHPEYASILENLAVVYVSTPAYFAAEQILKEVLTVRAMSLGKSHPDYAKSLSNLASLYIKMGKYDSVIQLNLESLEIRKKLLGEDHPEYAQGLINLAAAYMLTGNLEKGETLLQQSLAIRKKIMGKDHPDVGKVFRDLGMLYTVTGKYDLAETNLMAGANIFLHHIKNNFGNLNEAEKLQWWENERADFEAAPSLLIDNPAPSPIFLQAACSQQLQLKGFVLNDGTRLLKELRSSKDPGLQQLTQEWLNEKSILAKQYSLPLALRMPGLDSLEKLAGEVEKKITSASSMFRTSQQNIAVGFKEVQKQLQQQERAIEFIRFRYSHPGASDSILYAAFIISPVDTIPHFVVLCEEKKLASLLNPENATSEQLATKLYRGAKLTATVSSISNIADSLYNLIWKPLLPWLKGSQKITIAPAGLLHRVAFKALSADSATRLIDQYEIKMVSSVRQISEESATTSMSNKTAILLFGGINFDEATAITAIQKNSVSNPLPDEIKRNFGGGQWNALPGTLEEVKMIRQLYATTNRKVQIISGTEASEESLKALDGKSASILHLATHGFFLPDPKREKKEVLSGTKNVFTQSENPLLRSGLLMSGANRAWSGSEVLPGKEDGIVTAFEISNLNLGNTELVVLSACETALGDIKGTEGVFGLQRAFKLAGVKNILMSLWQVPDKETAELMKLFYSNKLKGFSTYLAFNEAQKVLRKKYPPYYWAAFVLLE